MLCRSIAVKGQQEILTLLKGAEMAEIRIEESGLEPEEVKELFGKHPCLLATCRPGTIPDKERMELLMNAIDGGAKWVDIEIESQQEYICQVISYARDHGCKVIISYHNYNCTPDIDYLRMIVEASHIQGADLVKVATMVKESSDNKTLLNLYSNSKIPLLAIGMGREGRSTRVKALKNGAPFTFVIAPGSKESAPGQYTEEEMIRILNEVK